eukprot:evm.model.scf_238EXC.12 EVM.evm.TU.scf_238EXC.12   scf_238EXC:106477-109432(+)
MMGCGRLRDRARRSQRISGSPRQAEEGRTAYVTKYVGRWTHQMGAHKTIALFTLSGILLLAGVPSALVAADTCQQCQAMVTALVNTYIDDTEDCASYMERMWDDGPDTECSASDKTAIASCVEDNCDVWGAEADSPAMAPEEAPPVGPNRLLLASPSRAARSLLADGDSCRQLLISGGTNAFLQTTNEPTSPTEPTGPTEPTPPGEPGGPTPPEGGDPVDLVSTPTPPSPSAGALTAGSIMAAAAVAALALVAA